MAAETWQMADPWRVHPGRVVVDDDSAEAIEQAVALRHVPITAQRR